MRVENRKWEDEMSKIETVLVFSFLLFLAWFMFAELFDTGFV